MVSLTSVMPADIEAPEAVFPLEGRVKLAGDDAASFGIQVAEIYKLHPLALEWRAYFVQLFFSFAIPVRRIVPEHPPFRFERILWLCEQVDHFRLPFSCATPQIAHTLFALRGVVMGELLLLVVLAIFISTLSGKGVISGKKDAAL